MMFREGEEERNVGVEMGKGGWTVREGETGGEVST